MIKNLNKFKSFFEKNMFGLKKLFLIIIFVFIFGLIGNAYGFLDFNFSHDSSMMVQTDSLWQVMIGRYLQPIYISVRGELYSPFLVGILSLIYISIATYLITEIFKIKSISGIILTSGICVTNSVFTLISATYIYLLDIFMFSLMCSCIGVYLCIKCNNKNVLAIIFFVISLGLYQSYWQVAIIIFMFSLVFDILNNIEYKKLLNKAFKYIMVLVSSILIYYILIEVFQDAYDVSSVKSYNSIPKLSTYLSVSNNINLIKGAYKAVANYYIHPSIYGKKLVSLLTILCFIINGIIILISSIKNKISLKKIVILVLLGLLLPLGGNIVYVITQGMEHGLMIYSLFIPYIFCLALYEHNNIKLKSNIELSYYFINIITVFILIFNGIIYSNQVYMKKHVEYNYTYATLNRVIYTLEQMDEYVPSTSKIMFIGSLEKSSISIKKNYFDYSAVGLNGTFAVTYLDTYSSFINNIIGYPMNIVTDEMTIKSFSNRQEVKNLKSFPSKNCVAIVDDIIVFKFSE